MHKITYFLAYSAKEMEFTEEKYNKVMEKIFARFPSFQQAGSAAYNPGIASMEFIDQMMGHPHKNYKIIHVAGTNGKGSVSNMLASALSAHGMKVGLYTSPHILDFRERMRIVDADAYRCVSKEYVWEFLHKWQDTFEHLNLSFFEITTIMALQWFADEKVDMVVLETGLGGRLDSTNIVTPVLSVITNIGLDHCDILGETLPEVAFEKAGIIKPRVPVVVGESHPETDSVFERKVLYINLPEPQFMGNRPVIMSLLTFADKTQPAMWERQDEILAQMDLQGAYQVKNLRTVLTALQVLGETCSIFDSKLHEVPSNSGVLRAFSMENCARYIINTARHTGFRGRWEKLSDHPLTICDIGHNEHGLRHNFAQLAAMKSQGKCSDLIIVYGSVADKDVDSVLHLMPEDATYIFTQAQSKRALPAEAIYEKYTRLRGVSENIHVCPKVKDAVKLAYDFAGSTGAMIYIGGSTYVVSEAIEILSK